MKHDGLVRRSRLRIHGRWGERQLTVDWPDDTYDEATLDERIWRAVIPIAIPNSNLAIRIGVMIEGTSSRGDRLPVCKQTLSLWRLAAIVWHLDVAGAVRIARGWMCLPVTERAFEQYEKSPPRIVHAQLLALAEGPTPVLSTCIHDQLPRLVATVYRGANPFWPRLCWVYGKTRLGSSCMAFTTSDISDFGACLAISDCPVRYRPATGERLTEWCAVQDLIDYLSKWASDPRVVDDGPKFSAHDTMDIANYLFDLQNRIRKRPGQVDDSFDSCRGTKSPKAPSPEVSWVHQSLTRRDFDGLLDRETKAELLKQNMREAA